MSVAVSYQFSAISTRNYTPATHAIVDMAPSVNGYVVTSTDGAQYLAKYYFGLNGADDPDGTTASAAGKDPHIAQLTNYTNVVVADAPNGISYSTYSVSHSQLASGTIGTSADSAPDVAALRGANGGYVIANQHADASTANDIQIHFRPASGPPVDFSVDVSAADDRAPVIAGLADGGFVVAWERHVGATTQAWVAVYNADGSARRAPAAFDSTGAINRDLAITALSSGGFAIAYADSQSGGDTIHTSVAFFNSVGTVKTKIQAPFVGPQESRQDIAVLSNGYVVAVSTDTTDMFFNTTLMSVIDPVTGAILHSGLLGGAHSSTQATGLIGLGFGDFVAGFQYDDSIDGGNVGNQFTHYQLVRTTTGDDGDNSLRGDAIVDLLYGGDGNDVLNGGGGADTMAGGNGNDVYVVDSYNDKIVESADAGRDVVRAMESYLLPENVEDLILLAGSTNFSGWGNAQNNKIVGNALANYLYGYAGNDWLDGAAGNDTMEGGIGDDTYVVRETGDRVIEEFGAGTDTVRSSITYRLQDNVENLLLMDGAINGFGNDLGNRLIGNAQNNALYGYGGNDWLDGGAGVDTAAGGDGDDTYVIRDVGDKANEAANGGFDTVRSMISFTLSANVEKLQLLGAEDLNGTGNASDNVLIGNVGANVLNGAAGADTMTGGKGDDTYYADNAGDTAIEGINSGHDLVRSSVSFTLANNIEDLTLTGTANLDGTGNGLSNLIIGNSGNNTLNGKAGADTLKGGQGNDTYIVDNIGDVVVEGANQGTDTVVASVAVVLANNVENLTLAGNGSFGGMGNGLANVLTGNAGHNDLDGAGGNDRIVGGLGNDRLTGGSGADVFVYSAGDGNDVFSDFNHAGGDVVELHGIGVDRIANNVAILSDGHFLTAQSGYQWTMSDFLLV